MLPGLPHGILRTHTIEHIAASHRLWGRGLTLTSTLALALALALTLTRTLTPTLTLTLILTQTLTLTLTTIHKLCHTSSRQWETRLYAQFHW